MVRKSAFVAVFALSALFASAQFAFAGFGFHGLLDAGTDALKAVSMSDGQVKSEALKAREYLDKTNELAPASSPYALRLARITQGMKSGSNQQFNIKAYIKDDVNAFSLADGTIRVYSGLMDKMNDDELRYVIAHEMGHVLLGHSKKKLQLAYAASAARKTGSASDNTTVSALSASVLGGFAEKLINAQFSQSEESAADKRALKIMNLNHYDPQAAVSALRKLEKMYGNTNGMLASHPAPGKRADALEKML
jgi:putative metalloprotease